MADPTGFMKFEREETRYRPVEDRKKDWREILEELSRAKVERQAARCMDCGVPFCQGDTGCPVDNLIPEWNDLVHKGREREALDRLHATNNFPEFTGHLCPAPCESACVLGVNSEPVTIKTIERNIIEEGFAKGWVKPRPASRKTGRKIAIVGSGPAGLAAAQELARAGHEVTVFEKAEKPGGLLRYGIPEFKMEKWRIDRRLAQMEAEGVRFLTGVSLGSDLSMKDLRAKFDAVGLAVGAERPRDLPIKGRELQGIHFAMEYLVGQNQALETGGSVAIDARDKRVIVIGGGDTGSDCVGTAHRQGATSVLQFEISPQPPRDRSARTPWPEWPLKLRTSHAHEEGGVREWSLATREFVADGSGRVRGLIAERLGASDESRGAQLVFDADLVLLAMGFTGPREDAWMREAGLELDARGAIATNGRLMTSLDGVFAAGDCRRGASLIVWAIREGRKMAQGIDVFLEACKHPRAQAAR